ncbi:serine/threonine-protein kinase [Actinoplanes solisilvae]|uniref:serine/threonine-protein kinase n=1 Tax=Actinoplanes solisilvae TaxID=2486853 RepID=UPI000FDB585C|nr:serine/threonine-protein kinase [Actinoplanes solisilvae]
MESGFLAGGRYRLIERLGHGGMSVVWRATDEVLGRDVALKVLAAQLATTELATAQAVLRHLRDEARAAAGLRHPNVVEVYDYGESAEDGRTLPYVVMELVDGRSLHDLLSGGALPWRLAVVIGAQVAAALAAAHTHGVVHRDVKPANVMVTSTGAKLVDFGISAAAGADDDAAGEILGTPAYLAPERISGGPTLPATDVYALGLLLYLALAGHQPWTASTVTQMMRAHVYYEPAPLPPVAGLPSPVVRLVRRCLAKRPAERPSAAEVTELLSEIAGLPPAQLLDVPRPHEGHEPHRTAALPTSVRPPAAGGRIVSAASRTPRRRVASVGVAAVVLLGTGLTAWAATDDNAGSPAVAVAGTAPTAAPSRTCTVRYALKGTATGRAAADVTILNTSPVAVPAWQLSFALPSDQRLLKGWSGTWKQQGRTVVAAGGRLPAGGTVATGFATAYGRVATLPVTFRLNGTECQAEMSVRAPAATTQPVNRSTARRPVADPPAAKQPGPGKPKVKPKPKGKALGHR